MLTSSKILHIKKKMPHLIYCSIKL